MILPSRNDILGAHFFRIPWGVTQCSEYLTKLIQLKYPNFPGKFTPQSANVKQVVLIHKNNLIILLQWMYRTHCSFAEDFAEQLRMLQDPLGMKTASAIVQFPYTAIV